MKTILTISRSVILKMRHFSYKRCKEYQNTHFKSNHFFIENSCCSRDTVEKQCRAGQATEDNMAHAHCMLDNKATDTHSEYIIIITFPLQQ